MMGERIHDWVDGSLGPKYESFFWEVLIRESRRNAFQIIE